MKAQRALPDDNLAYPVLITLSHGSTGSGFFLNTHQAVYLVTAKHVLFNPDTQKLIDNQAELTAYSKDPSDGESNVISLNLESLERIGDIKNHPLHDVTVVKIGDIPRQDQPSANAKESTQRALSMEPGVVVTKKAKLGIVGVPEEGIKIFNQMLIGNDIIVFGYPTSLGLQTKPQLDLRRPLLRKGIVAGENLLTRSIVLDCPVY